MNAIDGFTSDYRPTSENGKILRSSELTEKLLECIDSFCPLTGHYKDGRPAYDDQETGERWTLNPLRSDNHVGSFSVNLSTGMYHDFSTDESGSIIDLYLKLTGKSYQDAAKEFTNPRNTPEKRSMSSAESRKVPWAPPPDGYRPELECSTSPDAVYAYRNNDSQVLFYMFRLNHKKGKTFKVAYHGADGKLHYGYPKEAEAARPLFQLQELQNFPDKPVILVEGEKACLAAKNLFPGYVSVAWAGGASAHKKTDFSPLNNRKVYLWPDNDKPGLTVMRQIAHLLPHPDWVKILDVSGKPEKWDAADLEMEVQGNPSEAQAFLDELILSSTNSIGNKLPPTAFPYDLRNEEGSTLSQPDSLLKLISLIDQIELWHDPSGTPFITSLLSEACGTWPLSARDAELFLRKIWFLQCPEKALNTESLKTCIETLKAKARFGSRQFNSAIRLHGNLQELYIDFGNESWDVVKIDKDGWSIVSGFSIPVRFYRPAGFLPLPRPLKNGSIDDLRCLINADDEDTWSLIAGWLFGAFAPSGPYPGLIINGPQGSAKSSLSRYLQALVDPNAGMLRRMPKKEIDIIIHANNSWLLAFDNLSGLSDQLADTFCTLSTGGGFSTRRLYSNDEESMFSFCRPWLMNGIDAVSNRMDLVDRAIIINLPPIPPRKRREISELDRLFEEKQAAILGGLYTAISEALSCFPDTQVTDAPRMADFCRWVVSGESALGLERGRFLHVYRDNRDDILFDAVENDSYVLFLVNLLLKQNPWVGTTKGLLEKQEQYRQQQGDNRRDWPGSPQGVTKRLDRIQPLLDQYGIIFYRTRTYKGRALTITCDDISLIRQLFVEESVDENGCGGDNIYNFQFLGAHGSVEAGNE